MSLLPQGLGEQIPSSSPLELRNFSGLDLFHAEKWLLERGLISESSADTLVMYGYMVAGARNVALKVDLDLQNEGKSPSVEYTIRISRLRHLAYLFCSHLAFRGGIVRKLVLLLAIRMGAPVPGSIEGSVTALAKNLLPKGFEVRVNVES